LNVNFKRTKNGKIIFNRRILEFSEDKKKVLDDADFYYSGIIGNSINFCSNFTFSSFHLHIILIQNNQIKI